jgi:uncharacterized membrane-anchored protein YhcB (DUF1043 family)
MCFYLSRRQQLLILLIVMGVIIGSVTLRLRRMPKDVKKTKIEFTKVELFV